MVRILLAWWVLGIALAGCLRWQRSGGIRLANLRMDLASGVLMGSFGLLLWRLII
ncbi:MAG: hypothetical protein ACKVKO_03735 [Acidimicrobiales bacterium]